MADISISESNLAQIVESIITGVAIFAVADDRKLIPVYMNEGLYRMLSYSHKELDKMVTDIRRVVIPDDLPAFESGLDDVLSDNGAVDYEFRTVTGDGNLRWLHVRANLYGKLDGYPLVAGVILDCTERKRIEEELALQNERLNILSESVKEHFVDLNLRSDVLNIKLGSSVYSKDEIIIKNFVEKNDLNVIHPDDREILKSIIEAASKKNINDSFDFRSTYFEDDNDYHWYRATISSVRGVDGYVSRIVGRIVNIDETKKRELELQRRADKDALTGLYNKGTTQTLVAEAIAENAKNKTLAAMIMIDLDHFKDVNDTFGHAAGDKLLEDVGKVLNDSFKGRDIVGRMGGDEFMVFMTDIKSEDDATIISGRLNKMLTKQIVKSDGSITVTASIGIAICDASITDYDKLFARADSALYKTKESGRNGKTLYKE
ncbi:MAG: diguanylate cyclase [Lachnospiraceae bacterium]|nr:diguanylate cyclase [Lachnospiraceae bacterium]